MFFSIALNKIEISFIYGFNLRGKSFSTIININVNIKFRAHGAFLSQPSSAALQIRQNGKPNNFEIFGRYKTKGHTQDSQNRPRSI
jgi:hypothetical protein